jgi:hypothetical protein
LGEQLGRLEAAGLPAGPLSSGTNAAAGALARRSMVGMPGSCPAGRAATRSREVTPRPETL